MAFFYWSSNVKKDFPGQMKNTGCSRQNNQAFQNELYQLAEPDSSPSGHVSVCIYLSVCLETEWGTLMHCLLEKNLNGTFFFFIVLGKKSILEKTVATYCKLGRVFKGSSSHWFSHSRSCSSFLYKIPSSSLTVKHTVVPCLLT